MSTQRLVGLLHMPGTGARTEFRWARCATGPRWRPSGHPAQRRRNYGRIERSGPIDPDQWLLIARNARNARAFLPITEGP
jgi:hypothetical protein